MRASFETDVRNCLWQNVSRATWNSPVWQMQNRIVSLDEAVNKLSLSEKELSAWQNVSQHYCAITPYYATLFRSITHEKNAAYSTWDDPLRRQVVPLPEEYTHTTAAPAATDPLEEDTHMPVPGLIQRYPDRAVVLTGTICATYCRHCNRKRSWNSLARYFHFGIYEKMADYIRCTPAIQDVIISGGDPLLMSTKRLCHLIQLFHSISHVASVRIGSRVPVVLPMRITKELCVSLHRFSKIWIVTQFNHPDEITVDSAVAAQKIREAGIPINNQAVLLKGINDTVETQRALSRALQKIRVRPYYLFSCDRVAGTEHFWTTPERGTEIIADLYGTLGGLYIPRYVEDTPKGKLPRMP
jgi:lysine 2,3-aminomutase